MNVVGSTLSSRSSAYPSQSLSALLSQTSCAPGCTSGLLSLQSVCSVVAPGIPAQERVNTPPSRPYPSRSVSGYQSRNVFSLTEGSSSSISESQSSSIGGSLQISSWPG